MRKVWVFILLCVIGCASATMTGGRIHIQQFAHTQDTTEVNLAIEQFLKEKAENPTNIDAYLWLARAYAMKRNYVMAAAWLDTIIARFDSVGLAQMRKKYSFEGYTFDRFFYWRVYENAATTYLNKKDYRNALNAYLHAIRILPDSIESYNNAGYTYMQLNKPDSALIFYHKALSIHPNKISYRNIGSFYFKKNKIDSALKYFDKVVQFDSTDALVFYLIGLCAVRTKDTTKAVESFKKAMLLDSTMADAYYNLALLYVNQKKYKEAISVLTRAHKIFPDDHDISFLLGGLYTEIKDYEKALKIYTEIIEKVGEDPKWRKVYARRAGIYYRLGKEEEYKRDTEIFKKLEKQSKE